MSDPTEQERARRVAAYLERLRVRPRRSAPISPEGAAVGRLLNGGADAESPYATPRMLRRGNDLPAPSVAEGEPNEDWTLGSALRYPAEQEAARVAEGQAAERERSQRAIDYARRQRLAREAAYNRGLQQGINHDVANSEIGDNATAALSGTRQGLLLNLDDEIAGLQGAIEGRGYHQSRAEFGEQRRRDQMERPRSWVTAEERLAGPQRSGWATAGEVVGGLPWAAITPAAGANRVPGALGVLERMHSAGRAAAPLAAVSGFGRSEASVVPGASSQAGSDDPTMDYLRGLGRVGVDTAIGGAMGYGFGATGQGVAEGLGRLGRGVANELGVESRAGGPRLLNELQEDDIIRERIRLAEERAAADRLREASDGRFLLGNLRQLDEVPGGVRSVAEELRDAGVVAPRGTAMQSADDAVPRALVQRRAVGERIGAAEGVAERAAQAGNGEALVDLEPLAQGYAQIAERMNRAGDVAGAQRMMGLAERTAERGSVTMAEAREALSDIDAAIYGRHGGIPTPQVSQLDDEFSGALRRSLRSEMDSALERVTPTRGAPLQPGAQGPAEALPSHLADRRRYQALSAFGEASGDLPLRDAARRVVSPTDTAAGLAGGVTNGPVTGVAMWIANRVLRANEHGVRAMFSEREADALARELTSRLSAPVASRVMERLAPALARGRQMTALALTQLAQDEPEVRRAMAAPEDDADEARMRDLLPEQGADDVDEDQDEARMRDLMP